MATPARPKVFKNFINGEWVEARSGKAIENRNPANTDELVGVFPASTEKDVSAAVDAARAAFNGWRLTPAPTGTSPSRPSPAPSWPRSIESSANAPRPEEALAEPNRRSGGS